MFCRFGTISIVKTGKMIVDFMINRGPLSRKVFGVINHMSHGQNEVPNSHRTTSHPPELTKLDCDEPSSYPLYAERHMVDYP